MGAPHKKAKGNLTRDGAQTGSRAYILPEGTTPAIVTPELWQKAQDRLATNKGIVKRNESNPYLLRGHMTCAKCGRQMYPMPKQSKNGRRYRYYRCSSEVQIQYQRCGVSAVPADLCEQWVWDEVQQYLEKPELIAAEVQRIQEVGTDPQLAIDRQVAQGALNRNIQGQQRLVKRLREADSTLVGIIERELLEAERERQALVKTLEDLDSRIAEQQEAAVNLKNLYEYCHDVHSNLSAFDFNDKRLALEALGARVLANGRSWDLVANLPGVVVYSEKRILKLFTERLLEPAAVAPAAGKKK